MYIRQECLLSFDEIIKYQPKTKLKNDSKSANWGAKRDTDGNKILRRYSS